MPTTEGKENGSAYQKRIAQELKTAGYSLHGCQLVMFDFNFLENMLQRSGSDDMVDSIRAYLGHCARSHVMPGHMFKGRPHLNHVLVLDGGTILASEIRRANIRRARNAWRLNGGRFIMTHLCGCGMM